MVTRLITGYGLLISCLALVSCGNASVCEVPLTQLGDELKEMVIAEFNEQGITYEIADEGVICVSYGDAQEASVVLRGAVQTLIPMDTSQSMDEEVQRRVLVRLTAENIPFKRQQLDWHTYIVWRKDDDLRVRQIIEEEVKSYGDELLGD